MRSNLSRFLACALASVAVLGAFHGDAFADRRSSLAGNMLIVDQDDVYIYPQLMIEHRNLVSFDYFPGASLSQVLGRNADNVSSDDGVNQGGDPNALGPREESTSGLPSGANAMGGAGLLIFGEESFAFGVSTHRQDIYGSTPQAFLGTGDLQLYGNSSLSTWGILGYGSVLPGSVLVGTPTPTGNGAPSTAGAGQGVFLQPLQMADLLFGFGLGEAGSLGARLSVGQNTFRENRDGVSVLDVETWNTTAINLLIGFSLRGALYLDLNLELGLAFFSNSYETNEREPNYSDGGSLTPSFSLSGRSLFDLQEHVKLGVLGILHVNSSSVDAEYAVSETNATTPLRTTVQSSNFFVEAGAGPVYQLPDDTEIAAYGTVGFGSSSHSFEGFDLDGDDSFSYNTNALLLPGFKLALEHWLLDWLAFRTGLSSRYYFAFQGRELETTALPNVSATSTTYEFLWTAGLGVALGNFEFNGTLQTPIVTSGPHFIGGETPGMWALLNATYKF